MGKYTDKFKEQRRLYRQTKVGRAVDLLSNYRQADKKAGRENDLTKEFIVELMDQPCIYCGSTDSVGADRLDNTEGHTVDNIVPSCPDCNRIRNNIFTHEEMLELGKHIAEIKSRRIDLN